MLNSKDLERTSQQSTTVCLKHEKLKSNKSQRFVSPVNGIVNYILLIILITGEADCCVWLYISSAVTYHSMSLLSNLSLFIDYYALCML